jgi:CMP-N-acetylneuraminic acid synthetase/mannose-6-phosphate isomerase-like protein (cupin superfamily)
MKIVCMIPARLGSKRVKSKNLRLLDGKPLVCHVMEKAKQAGIFADVYLNSEAEIFEPLCRQYETKFYKRPMALAADDATNDMFVLDFIDQVKCDIIIQINPTSPLITVEEIKDFVKMMVDGKYDTLHGVKEERIEGLFKGQPLNFDPLKKMPRSQDLESVMLFSSGIMGWRIDNYRQNIKKYGAATYGGDGKIGYFTLKNFATIDIDNEIDFQMAELAIAYQKNPQLKEPQYYQPDEKLRYERDVMEILIKDGVVSNNLEEANKLITNIKDIINSQDNTKSWSKRLVNTESNSATLILQQPGEGNRLHHHKDWNEWWYIVDGEWAFEIEGKTTTVKAGDLVLIQKNKWHKITAIGNKPAIRLAVSKDKVAHIYKEDE